MPLEATALQPGRPSGPFAYMARRWQAMILLVIGRAAAAEAVFTAMLQRWPGDAYALASRAHVRAQAGRLDDALADATALVERHPQRSAGDWFNLGFLQERHGRLDDAAASFRRAVAMDERLDRAWYGLGVTLAGLGRLDEAVEALHHNTRLQPMSPYGWVQLARVQVRRRESAEAVRIIRHLRRFEPAVAEQLRRETGLAA